MEDDDPVIFEFDLNLNSATRSCDLFTFAAKDYPFQEEKDEDAALLFDSIRVKPILKQFEIKLQFNENNDTLCKKKNNELTVHQRKRPTKNSLVKVKLLKSNHLPQTLINYGACYLTSTKKVLDIWPVGRVFDFHTDFTQLNEDHQQQRYATPLSSPTKQSEEALLSPEVHNFTLRYETNFDYSSWSHVNYCRLRERADKEQWQELQCVKKDFKHTIVRCSAGDDADANGLRAENKRYCLMPQELIAKQEVSSDYESMNSVSLARLSKLQLSEKINRLLINCRVIPFSRLVSLTFFNNKSDLDEELLIKILQKSAMLVQGNWVVKSEVLYPATGSTNELSLIHDHLSFLFTKKLEFKRKDLSSKIKFPLDSLQLVLEKLAKFDQIARKWTFMYSTDHEFLKRHPTLNEQQQLLWNIRSKNLYLQVEKYRENPSSHATKRVHDEIGEKGLVGKAKKVAAASPSKRLLRKKRVKII